MDKYDIIIIGSGGTGLAAAMYCGRFGMKTLVIGDNAGGVITLTHVVENYPGFIKLTGQELADNIKNHTMAYSEFVTLLEEKVDKIEKEGNEFKVSVKDKSYSCKALIYATGANWRKLGVPGEKEFENKGVAYCALCDGPIFRNKTVAVIGGSDTSAKDALLLTQYCKKVYIIYRKEEIRPEPINKKRVEANEKIEIINNTNVKEIKGDKFVTSVILDKPYNNSDEFKLDGVFIAIGHIPNTDLIKDLGVELNEKGEVVVDRKSRTNLKGFYAAGDVVDTDFKQLITGVAEGVQAAFHAYEYIDTGEY